MNLALLPPQTLPAAFLLLSSPPPLVWKKWKILYTKKEKNEKNEIKELGDGVPVHPGSMTIKSWINTKNLTSPAPPSPLASSYTKKKKKIRKQKKINNPETDHIISLLYCFILLTTFNLQMGRLPPVFCWTRGHSLVFPHPKAQIWNPAFYSFYSPPFFYHWLIYWK